MNRIYDELFARSSSPLGADAEQVADQLRHMGDTRQVLGQWSFAATLNQLGVPQRYLACANDQAVSLAARFELYEQIGFVSPALIFSAPGPSMAAYVVAGLGSEQQQDAFFGQFQRALCWSCFAMTEPTQGSDAGAMQTTATAVDGGYLIHGSKMFIGNGVVADTGVLFARTAPGQLGINAFVFSPQNPAVTRQRLSLTGLDGTNLALMHFDDLFIPTADLLGQHLKPTQRFAQSAMATFDALRPCVGALALGVARRALQEWHACVTPTPDQSQRLAVLKRRWSSAYRDALTVCQRADAQQASGKSPGMVKTACVVLADEIVSHLIHAFPKGAQPVPTALWQAFRDVKAFEYTEGTRQVHQLGMSFSPPPSSLECR
ncbi:acyl-CoA dehydrogenase [Pseudomonas sp. MUP55]|uniref:acyl-CoA dehydrogenase family protein n=1 Tax=Pseudomonas sp. MUP55 TaxID=3087234 RepID=UPI002A5AFF62|nr:MULTISPECIES: acyl-CoA dehydrogenase [unclassified Pseudomonas]WPN91141.1 acyl-CoA dehydrogenase [Pseudomonas sp. MUP56]WPN96667.1 acyl-CoA dehydrogenase [Pseudomonas sp. MUP55]